MKSFLLFVCAIICVGNAFAQTFEADFTPTMDTTTILLPFRQIPSIEGKDYQPGNILSRFVDGLGFRFHWATEGLTEKDLTFRPSEQARTTLETVEHIYGLSVNILHAAQNVANVRTIDYSKMDFNDFRLGTLRNLEKASALFAENTVEELEELEVIFESDGKRRTFPLWNLMNGQISDAIYHTGQIVSFRRMTENPMDAEVNVFLGIRK